MPTTNIYIYILGVARYTDVMVRYVPRFGGQGQGQGFLICHMINYTGYNQK